MEHTSYVTPWTTTAHHLQIAVLVISHGVVEMVNELRFISQYYSYLAAGFSVFHLFAHTTATVEKFIIKARFWDKSITRNLNHSAAKSIHMLASDGAPTHVDWLSTEAVTEGLTALSSNLWKYTQPLLAELLSLV